MVRYLRAVSGEIFRALQSVRLARYAAVACSIVNLTGWLSAADCTDATSEADVANAGGTTGAMPTSHCPDCSHPAATIFASSQSVALVFLRRNVPPRVPPA